MQERKQPPSPILKRRFSIWIIRFGAAAIAHSLPTTREYYACGTVESRLARWERATLRQAVNGRSETDYTTDDLHPKRSSVPRYAMTRSARTMIVCGNVMPRLFAVLRLTTNSNLVGCSIGSSLALAPRKIRSTKYPSRRKRSLRFGP